MNLFHFFQAMMGRSMRQFFAIFTVVLMPHLLGCRILADPAPEPSMPSEFSDVREESGQPGPALGLSSRSRDIENSLGVR